MGQYDNTNRGVLFKNLDKDEDNQPDYTGTLDVGGKEFRLAAWIKESKKGTKFMSLSVSQPDGGARRAEKDDDDSIPF